LLLGHLFRVERRGDAGWQRGTLKEILSCLYPRKSDHLSSSSFGVLKQMNVAHTHLHNFTWSPPKIQSRSNRFNVYRSDRTYKYPRGGKRSDAAEFILLYSSINIEALCAAPPEALAHSPSQMPLSCPVVPASQREPHKDGGGGGGGVAGRARAWAPKAKSCATSCGTSSKTPCAASFTCSSFM